MHISKHRWYKIGRVEKARYNIGNNISMKKLIEFSEEDMVHIATIKERYGLRYDVDLPLLS